MNIKRILPVIALSVLISLNMKSPLLASEKKKAVLVDVKLAMGIEEFIIQGYNIDGQNYIRARELTDQLLMDIVGVDEGVIILPEKHPGDTTDFGRLTDNNIEIELKDGYVYTDGIAMIKSKYFNYKDRNYFKIADMGASSQEYKKYNMEFSTYTTRPPLTDVITAFNPIWVEEYRYTYLEKEVIDVLAIYNEHNGITGKKKEIVQTPLGNSEGIAKTEEGRDAQGFLPEYKSASEIPKFPAKILNTPITEPTNDNTLFNRPYSTYGAIGECAWYAIGRFHDVFGIRTMNRADGDDPYQNGKANWMISANNSNIVRGIPYLGNEDLSNIPNRGMAVWTGHVIFVEYVERDSNGYPVKYI